MVSFFVWGDFIVVSNKDIADLRRARHDQSKQGNVERRYTIAFPVGMMQEIVKVRGILTTYLAALTPSPSPQGEAGWFHTSKEKM